MAAAGDMTDPPGVFRAGADRSGDGKSVPLLDADPGFDDAVPPADRDTAAGVQLRLVRLASGTWPGPGVGSLVVSGLLMRTLHRYDRASLEMYGPGDLVGGGEPEEGRASWRIVHETALVALDERFEIAAHRWPALWRIVLERSTQRTERLASHLAALQLSRVDARIEAVLYQLAERFGKVTPEGVVVPIALTHAMLGHLTAAKRPTISVAVGELAAQRRVVRLDDGGWLLYRSPN